VSRLVRAGAALALAGTVHAAVNSRLLRRPALGDRGAARVSVLIPARDEAVHIAACLGTVLGQPGVAEVLVLDDGSSDDTAALAAAAGATVIAGPAPPAGWLGKPHACAQLAAAADPASDVLVFLDADVRLAPGAISAAVALLERTGLDMITPHPRQVAITAGERLVQPLLQWSVLTLLPLRLAERSSRPSLGAAIGQFVVVRRATYERAGGHGSIKDALLDDLALLKSIKRVGGHGALVDGTELASCRMYESWAELQDGYAKSLWSAFGSRRGGFASGSEAAAVAVGGALTLAYLLPPLAALRGSRAGLVGYVAGVAGRVITARATGGRPWPDAAAHPISIAAFLWLTARSLLLRRRGTLSWKGRTVPARSA